VCFQLLLAIRCLATDLSQSHCTYSTCTVFNSHTKFSCHRVIHFLLSITFDCRLPEFRSTTLSLFLSLLIQFLTTHYLTHFIFFWLDTPLKLFWLPNELSVEVKVEVMLLPTVSQSVLVQTEWLAVVRNVTLSKSSQNQSHIATDQILIITVWQLRSCFCGVPSLTRGRICLLHMLLPLASAVFLGSKSVGTRDHILLSQIWDFPFRRLLRFTGMWLCQSQSQSQSYFTTGGLPPISSSWRQAPWGPRPEFFFSTELLR
jgi:hypothetical protein